MYICNVASIHSRDTVAAPRGGADGAGAGVPAVTCAPAGKGKPLFHSVMQHQLFASHIIIFHTKRGQLFGAHNTREDGIYFESKFSRFSGGNTRAPFAGGRATPITHSPPAARPGQALVLESRPSCPLEVMVPTGATATNSWRRH